MKTNLTSRLDSDEAKLFTQEWKASAFMRRKLREFVDTKKVDKELAFIRSKQNYESPSWALTQADSIGYMRAYEEILSILED